LSGRGLCDELITRPEESYRLCCVVVCDLETSRIGAPYIYNISNLRVNIIFTLIARSRELPLPLVFTTFVYSVLVSIRCTVVFYPFHPPKTSPHKNVR